MKISKNILRKIIREEIKNLNEEIIAESNIKVLSADKIDSKVWNSMKYDLKIGRAHV